jgi:3-hydroxybutyryl-CoA dehydrogenase
MIEKVTVFGAGTMGRGIAQVAALAGLAVTMQDLSEGILQPAVQAIRANMAKGVEKGKLEARSAEAALGRLSVATDPLQAAEGAGFIIEAIVENLETKKDLFMLLDRSCPAEMIIASNTSALSLTELASATRRPDRVVGTHFFNPVPLIHFVEIVRGLETSAETIETTASLMKRMKKEAVVISDSPGFITSRVNVMIGNEAFNMLQEGVASAQDIDKALKLGLNHPMGPFELVDLVGLDIRLSVLRDLHARLGEKFRPSPLLVKYVNAGRLGKKVRRGVYGYDEDGKRLPG